MHISLMRDFGSAIGTIALHFNPIKLAFLIAWFYLCLYCAQRSQFSGVVATNQKALINMLSLLFGPIPLIVLILSDSMKQSSKNGGNLFEIIIEHVQEVFAGIRSSRLFGGGSSPLITLMDSAGREIKEIYGKSRSKKEDRHVLDKTEQIILDTLESDASDLLIDPKNKSFYTVRFRVDGILRIIEEIEVGMCQAVINSIKAVSMMDISERRRPQDGSFSAKWEQGTAAFRVASAGVLNGEKLSIRVLNQRAGQLKISDLGFSEKQYAVLAASIKKPSGMILICGPTGSGKTTSLYAMLNEIDFYTRNVITVEDPIECELTNISQIEINPKADITFAKSLRSILRQDPDIICVGEIRDEETAGIGLRAAQTGHLVLATLHSETNASSMIRLMDLNVSPLLLASGLSLIISQRLVRKLCDQCKEPANLSPAQIRDFHRKKINCNGMNEPTGCEYCHDTGYKGRIGIYDFLIVDDKLKALISKQQLSADMLRNEGDKKGRSNLYKQGLRLVVSGITSFDELKRVVG